MGIGNWELGIGNWALGIGHWSIINSSSSSASFAPSLPLLPHPLTLPTQNVKPLQQLGYGHPHTVYLEYYEHGSLQYQL